MEWFWGFVVGFVVGAGVWMILSGIANAVCTARGTLRIDHSNPEKDVYRFEIDDLDKLSKKKYVELKIDHNANLSQN